MKVISKNVIIALKSATIELNQEELEFLRDVFNMIGGDPMNSRRRIANRIRDSLAEAGMNMDPSGDLGDRQGDLYFLDAKDLENKNKAKSKKILQGSRWDDEVPF